VSESQEDISAKDTDAKASCADISDAQLIERTKRGNRQAFDELIRRYHKRALAVAYRLLNNTHDAAEVTQDAFLKAYTSLNTLEDTNRFGGWLLRIVTNLSLNRRRGRKASNPLPINDMLGSDPVDKDGPTVAVGTSRAEDPYQQVAGHELGERIKLALEQLPEKQRLALVLFTMEQLPQKEVAQILQCSVEAVKWHVFEGRRKLKQILADLLKE